MHCGKNSVVSICCIRVVIVVVFCRHCFDTASSSLRSHFCSYDFSNPFSSSILFQQRLYQTNGFDRWNRGYGGSFVSCVVVVVVVVVIVLILLLLRVRHFCC